MADHRKHIEGKRASNPVTQRSTIGTNPESRHIRNGNSIERKTTRINGENCSDI